MLPGLRTCAPPEGGILPLWMGGPGPLQLRGERGPFSRCELGGGGVWNTGSKGRALLVPSANKAGGEPDLPNFCVKSRVIRPPAVLVVGPARGASLEGGREVLGNGLQAPRSRGLPWAGRPGCPPVGVGAYSN